MTTDTDLLEQIVSGVMRQLTSLSGEIRSDGPGTTEPTSGTTTTNELLLTDNVITADLLSERLGRAAGLSIGPTSVLTPSARDWLRERNIVWHRQTQNRSAIAATESGWKVIVECPTPAVTAALDEGVGSTGHPWVTETADDFATAVRAAVSAVCRAETDGVVLFTSKSAAAACRANRNRKIRAAVVMGEACVRAVRRQMGANLLCVDPTGRTAWELKTILRELERGGWPTPPDNWQE